MNNLFVLFKINLANAFKFKSSNKRKQLLIIFAVIYIIGTLVTSLGMFLSEMFKTLEKINLVNFYIPILFAIASLFSVFFTIFSAKGWLFENKDNDLLLSLPIKKSTVLTSRLLLVVMYNLVISLLFIVPGIAIYLSNVAVQPLFYISIIIMTLLLPIIPSILSSLFGYLIAFITSKTSKKNVVELLSYTIFIALYMLLVSNSNDLINKLVGNVKLLETILNTVFLPITLINKGIVENNFINMIYYILINGVLLFLFVLTLNKRYFKIISRLGSHKTNSNYQMHTLKTRSRVKTLRHKEIKRYFSSAIYVFNTLIGVVLLIVAGLGSLFYSADKLMALANLTGFSSFGLVFTVLSFGIVMTETTNSCISIERNNFWILKSLPISTKEIFNSKLFVNKILVIPVVVISTLLFMISGYVTVVEMLLLMSYGILLNLFISNFGLITNLLFPKLDAISDTVVVKQSVAAMLGLLGPFFIILIGIGVLISTDLANISILCIVTLISLIAYLISNFILYKWGINRFRQIN